MAENIDLAKTFAAIGKTELPSDGHSLVPLLRGWTPADWRDAVLVEHNGSDLRGVAPDFQQPASGTPRTYNAIRTHQFLYVQYNDGEREFYDLKRDPFELHNLAGSLTAAELAPLHAEVRASGAATTDRPAGRRCTSPATVNLRYPLGYADIDQRSSFARQLPTRRS